MKTREELAEILDKIRRIVDKAPWECIDEGDCEEMGFALDEIGALIPEKRELFGPDTSTKDWDDLREYNAWVRKTQASIDALSACLDENKDDGGRVSNEFVPE